MNVKGMVDELARLEAKRKEVEQRIELLKEDQLKRQQLLAYIKKEGFTRSDVGWVYVQLPLLRLTRASRLKRIAEKHGDAQTPQKKKRKQLPKPENMAMAKRIRELRTEKGLTGVQIGLKLGMHSSMVTSWERGLYVPTPMALPKLEKILGGSLKEFIPHKEGE